MTERERERTPARWTARGPRPIGRGPPGDVPRTLRGAPAAVEALLAELGGDAAAASDRAARPPCAS